MEYEGKIEADESNLIVHLPPWVNIREHRRPMPLPAKYCPPFWCFMDEIAFSQMMIKTA